MIGQSISHYRITGQLGSGGMGVVYEAQDLTLGRSVALKFLPLALAGDPAALDRFLLEARSASALNHPNICTIYAVENADGQSFIAMELLDGQSLDVAMHSGPLAVDRILDVSIQLADALDAAHMKGIVHRDIKPANLFITQRGQVKVLDFGLAKLMQSAETETIGTTAHLTTPGATVGTIAYMSPEQARGEVLDARTDLFSAGTVLYQMATGQMPFAGNTSAVIFQGILGRDPVPPQQIVPSLPAKLQEIIDKLLEKDRELRYQSAADLRGDLKRLKRDSDSRRTPGAAYSSSSEVRQISPAHEETYSSSVREPALGKPSSSAVVAAVRENKIGTGVTVVIVLALLAAAAYGIYALATRGRTQPFRNISVNKITDSGNVIRAALSPDSKYILILTRTNGLASLWLRNIPTNSNTQVSPPAPLYYLGVRFSPDGNYIYFERSEPGNDELKNLYRAPLFGGTPQKLLSDIDSNITFSPDGHRFAFIRNDNPEPGKYQLIVRSVDGGEETVLNSGPVSETLFQPAWSPDGSTIMCGAIQPGGAITGLVAVDVSSGKRRIFFNDKNRTPSQPTWLPDGRGLALLFGDQSSSFNRTQVGYISYPEAVFSPITRDTNNYAEISISGDGGILSAIVAEEHWNIFVMPTGADAGLARQLTTAQSSTNFTWTRDAQLIGDQSNRLNLINSQLGEKTTIASEEGSGFGDPTACGDGRYVAFLLINHGGAGNQNVWRMDSSGGKLKQLTSGKREDYPWCSADGRNVFYLDVSDETRLMEVPIEGGTSRTISELPVSGSDSNAFDLSENGKMAAFATMQHAGEHKEKLAVVATDSGQTLKLVDFERPRFGLIRFSPDGKAVVYPVRENGVDNLWLQPLDGSTGKRITNFTAERIWDFHWSPDGKQLALDRGHTDSDVVLFRESGK